MSLVGRNGVAKVFVPVEKKGREICAFYINLKYGIKGKNNSSLMELVLASNH